MRRLPRPRPHCRLPLTLAVDRSPRRELCPCSQEVESCYSPVVQSGAKWSLKASAIANDEIFAPGPVVGWLGVKYHDYCANVGRTYIIEPTSQHEADYKFLLEVQAFLLKAMTAGKELGQVHAETVAFVQEKRADLLPHLTKTLGFLTGIEFRDSGCVIKKANSRTLVVGCAAREVPPSSAPL